jgi:hypothetical protein
MTLERVAVDCPGMKERINNSIQPRTLLGQNALQARSEAPGALLAALPNVQDDRSEETQVRGLRLKARDQFDERASSAPFAVLTCPHFRQW